MNSVELIGRLTRDPELRKAASGTSIFKFTLAVNRRFKQPGQPDADFIFCTAFGKTADIMCQYLHKGSLIGVTGRIQTGSYDNQQGQRVYTTDVIIDNFEFLESKNASQGQNYGGNAYGNDNYGGNPYSNQSYDNYEAPEYGGGYQNRGNNDYGNRNGNGGGYGAGSFGQDPSRNSYKPSSSNGGSQPSYGASKNSYASSQSNDLSDAFDDTDTLDIASDDLPF